MKRVLLIVGIVTLIAVAAGAFGVFSLLSFGGNELKPKTLALLKDVEDGRVDDAYGRTSGGFRASVSLDEFRGVMDATRTMMGRFLEAGRVSGTSWKSDSSGSTGEVKMTLRYERGETAGTFRFVKEEGDWRLLGFEIPFPEGAKPVLDRAALEQQAKSLLDLLREQRDLAFYDQLSPELRKAWPAEKFQKDITGLRERVGTLRSATLAEITDDEKGSVHLRFDVEFDRAKGEAKVTYGLRGARGGPVGFHLR